MCEKKNEGHSDASIFDKWKIKVTRVKHRFKTLCFTKCKITNYTVIQQKCDNFTVFKY